MQAYMHSKADHRLRGCVAAATLLLAACGAGNSDPPNVSPVAVASADADCFNGFGSSDADGDVVAWQWDRQENSSTPLEEVLLEDGAILCIRVQRMHPNDPDPHRYAYRLTVTDDRGATNSEMVEAWVPENAVPLQGIAVDAGPDQAVTPGQQVLLSGAVGTGEFPCNAASCVWEQLTGPDVGVSTTASCSAGSRLDAGFTAPSPAEGEVFLGFRLTAFDDSEPGCESRGYVGVTVRPAP